MIPQKSIQPMELVISAIHCLKDRRGSSPREILKYLEGKYGCCAESLRLEVETGLKRGVSFGLINRTGGLYRLNEILRSPLRPSVMTLEKFPRTKIRRNNMRFKRLKIGKSNKKIGKSSYPLQKRKKKAQISKAKRKIKQKKIIKGRNLRRQADLKRRKIKSQKSKTEKTHKLEKIRKLQTENPPENNPLKVGVDGKI